LGEPIDDIGSGLNVYVYQVGKSTVLVSINAADKLVGVTLQNNDDSEEKLLK
jgi:hypothetical protein